MPPVVSVIMPAFNTGRWIRQAIQSVLVQSLTDVEVLVVDDCSTDDTTRVVESIQDERVRLLRQPENRGVSAARNRALAAAQGQWAAILDSDDWLAQRDRLADLVRLGEEHNADLVGDDIFLVQDGKDCAWSSLLAESGLRLDRPQVVDLPMFVSRNLGLIKPLLRLPFVREHGCRYDEDLRMVEDWVFLMECLLAGARFVLSPEAGYAYRIRSGSLSRDVLALLNQVEKNLCRYLVDARLAGRPEVVSALERKLRSVRADRRYYGVMGPLKQGKVAVGVAALARTPEFPLLLARRVPRILSHRVRRRLVKLELPIWN